MHHCKLKFEKSHFNVIGIKSFFCITDTPCQLHCKPKEKFFSVMLKDTVIDGTPCTPGTKNMCISGKCMVSYVHCKLYTRGQTCAL